MASRVVVIGLDGATFALLRPLASRGVLPFLTSVIRGGTAAELMSTRNPLTPPAWTSMITGVSPETHGIYDFLRPTFLEDGGVYLKVNDRRDNHAESVFAMANRGGQRAAALNFFGFYPAPEIDGYVASGFVPWRHLRGGVHPKPFFESLKASADFDYRALGMDIGEEKKVVQGLDASEHEDWIELQTVRDRAWTDVTCRLLREDPVPLTAVVLDGPDKMQHLFWRYLDEDCFAGEPGPETDRIRALCLGFYAAMDDNIRRIVEAAGPDADILIVSDHGFGPTTEIVYVNEWLARHGYLAWSRPTGQDEKGQLVPDKIRDHMNLVDWRNTVAFCPTPSSNAIYVKPDPGNGIGVTPDGYLDLVTKLRRELLDWRDPQDGKPVFVAATANKLRGRPFVEPCPDLTLAIRDGGFVSIMGSDRIVKPRALADGTHRPEGVFVGFGPSFQAGEQLDPLGILDIAPLLLTLLGLPVPRDLEGRVPVEALRSHVAVGKRGEATHAGAAAAPAAREEPSEEEREALLRQMKKLGYMD